MPEFSWTGRTSNGQEVSGSIEAQSKESVIGALRTQNITVTTITEHGELGASKPIGRRLARFAFALLLLAGAALMGLISKGTRIHCAGSDCTVATTMAGFRTTYTETVRGAHNVAVEKQSAITGNRRGGGRAAASHLIITGGGRPFSTEWLQNPFPGSEYAAHQLNDAFARQVTADTWQIEAAPAAVAIVLALVGLWLLIRAAAA